MSDQLANIDFSELEYEFSLKPHMDAALAEFIIRFSGFIECWDDDQLADIKIGEISGYRIDMKRANAKGPGYLAILEQVSPEIADFAEFMPIACGGEALLCEGLIYVNEISIDPRYRSMGLGSDLLNRIPQMMDVRHSLIALKAFPITYEYGKVSNPDAVRRVKRFYEKLGFDHVGGEYMSKRPVE